MNTYLALNLLVLSLLVCIVFVAGDKFLRRRWLIAASALLVMTAVFDSAIIAAGIVGYSPQKLLGWYVWRAPIEDFAYTIAALLLVPLLWKRTSAKK